MNALYYVQAEGITCMVPFASATDASVWALKNVTPMGVPFRILKVEAEGVH